jgi:lysophospholipase L1-like esterase
VLARFNRDALNKLGVRWVLLTAGVNDIATIRNPVHPNNPSSADEVIAGFKTLIARARANRVKIWGATIPPWGGNKFYSDSTNDLATRDSVNQWIRTSGAFDRVVDFDVLLRDPDHPERLRPSFDSGDHLHPNDEGYFAMAYAIDFNALTED